MINLLHGDCIELLQDIPDNSVDFVLSDLPYGTTQCKWDTPIDLAALWPQLTRVAKDRAAIALFAQTPFDKVLGASNLPMLRYEWIWEKTNATGFLNSKKMPLKAHENILIFYKKLPEYNPQMTTGHPVKKARRKSLKSEVYGRSDRDTFYESTARYPRSVIRFPSDKQKLNLHPTQKPEALTDYMIETYTSEGQVVLDVCCGSGTTGASAVKLGREFIGMEKEKKYFDVSRARIMTTEEDYKTRIAA